MKKIIIIKNHIPLGCNIDNQQNLSLVNAKIHIIPPSILQVHPNLFNNLILWRNLIGKLITNLIATENENIKEIGGWGRGGFLTSTRRNGKKNPKWQFKKTTVSIKGSTQIILKYQHFFKENKFSHFNEQTNDNHLPKISQNHLTIKILMKAILIRSKQKLNIQSKIKKTHLKKTIIFS